MRQRVNIQEHFRRGNAPIVSAAMIAKSAKVTQRGTTAEVSHGSLPYDVPQAWSQGLFRHPLALTALPIMPGTMQAAQQPVHFNGIVAGQPVAIDHEVIPIVFHRETRQLADH